METKRFDNLNKPIPPLSKGRSGGDCLLVLADDITGAAEIAGIAHSNGLDVKFLTSVDCELPSADVLVIATDTRSADKEEAEETSKRIAELLKDKDFTLFKKTDSVLRGHVVAELHALMLTLGFEKALLLPQNPSKGRIIREGRYFINDTPLEETSFSYDPEFPATTSIVEQYVPGVKSLALDGILGTGINVADATSQEEIDKQIRKADGNTLLAGAADFFTTLLYIRGLKGKADEKDIPWNSNTIIVCGSTQSKSLDIGIEETTMPEDVFHGTTSADNWISHLKQVYDEKGSLIITIGHAATGGKSYAVRLRDTMAEAAKQLIALRQPEMLIIEGGATAFALLHRIGWHQFTIEKEFLPGVVCMRHGDTHIILKPGSYPWGDLWK